jgi:hypothetical protein
MDDLDKLLLNVDESTSLAHLKENEKINKAKAARKADTNLGEEVYDTNSNESFESIFEKLQQSDSVQSFSHAPIEGIKPHWNYVIDFKNLLSDMTLPETVIVALRKFKYTYLRSIENIESLYETYYATMSMDDFLKKAKQEVHYFFQGQETTNNHINFLILIEVFLRYRTFNSVVKKHWKEIGHSINGMSLVNESGSFMEKAKEIILSGLKTCKDTDEFLVFIAAILHIPKKDLDIIEKEVQSRVFYKDIYDYDYRTQFKLEIKHEEHKEVKKSAQYHVKTEGNDIVTVNSIHSDPKEEPKKEIEVDIKKREMYETISKLMKVPGKSSWNINEPYIINIDLDELNKNEEDLIKSIAFVQKLMPEKEVDAMVKRALIRAISAHKYKIDQEYEEFLFKTVTIQSEKIQRSFHSPNLDMDLFLYHCGPMTVFQTIKRIFTTSSIGTCFKRLSNNKITRFIPYEYIKVAIMRYFNENVFIHDLPFNSIQDYNSIKQYMHSHYKETINENRRKIEIAVEHKYKQTGKKLSVSGVLMRKLDELYAPHEIEVYRRFNDRTLFRQV